MQVLLRYCKDVPEQKYSYVSTSFNDFELTWDIDTKVEHVPRVEDGKSAVATSHTRTQGSKGAVHADIRIGCLNPAIQFRWQSTTHYVIHPSANPAARRHTTTNGSRSH